MQVPQQRLQLGQFHRGRLCLSLTQEPRLPQSLTSFWPKETKVTLVVPARPAPQVRLRQSRLAQQARWQQAQPQLLKMSAHLRLERLTLESRKEPSAPPALQALRQR
jgi:hypothetical protein